MNAAGPRVPPLVALAVGLALWFVPTVVQRVLWPATGGDTLNFDVVLLSRCLTRRVWPAALVSYVVFVGSHVPGSGWATTLTMVAVGSLLFVGLYWLRRNLPLCAGAHAITNLLILANA
ncbi:CPBP family glutamic-type intramembrane protease [Nonomuraea angiospora]|uniref:CPBP family glutamic-type intramembrane protease n=1 Tax=Nonomuraea angiospora TaxID=46172 RepID=UPI0034213979